MSMAPSKDGQCRAVMLAMAAMTSKHRRCLELAGTRHAPVKRDDTFTQAGPSHLNSTFFSMTSWPEPPYVFSHTAYNQLKS